MSGTHTIISNKISMLFGSEISLKDFSFQEAWEVLNNYAYEYNYQRLHAGINYLRPADMFFGLGAKILCERESKLSAARANRQDQNRKAHAEKTMH